MKIVVSGLPIEHLDPRKVFLGIKIGIQKSIITLEGTAKRETPVDKGFLRNGYRSRFSDLFGELNNTVKYAPWVHDGHTMKNGRQSRSNPFLTRAVIAEEYNIQAIFDAEFRKLYNS